MSPDPSHSKYLPAPKALLPLGSPSHCQGSDLLSLQWNPLLDSLTHIPSHPLGPAKAPSSMKSSLATRIHPGLFGKSSLAGNEMHAYLGKLYGSWLSFMWGISCLSPENQHVDVVSGLVHLSEPSQVAGCLAHGRCSEPIRSVISWCVRSRPHQ